MWLWFPRGDRRGEKNLSIALEGDLVEAGGGSGSSERRGESERSGDWYWDSVSDIDKDRLLLVTLFPRLSIGVSALSLGFLCCLCLCLCLGGERRK